MNRGHSIWPIYRRLLGYVKPYRGRLAGGILLGVGYSASNGATLLVVKQVWQRVFEEATGPDLGWMQALALAGLAALDRSGVPAYALYAPGETTPRLLPEVLTPGIVTDALAKLPKAAR